MIAKSDLCLNLFRLFSFKSDNVFGLSSEPAMKRKAARNETNFAVIHFSNWQGKKRINRLLILSVFCSPCYENIFVLNMVCVAPMNFQMNFPLHVPLVMGMVFVGWQLTAHCSSTTVLDTC